MVHLEEHARGSARRATSPPLESTPVHTRTMPHGGSFVLPATGTSPCGRAPPTRYGYRDPRSAVAVTRERMLAAMDSDHGGPTLATYCTPGVSRRVRHAASSDRESAQEQKRRARDQTLPGPAARRSGSRDRPGQAAAAKEDGLVSSSFWAPRVEDGTERILGADLLVIHAEEDRQRLRACHSGRAERPRPQRHGVCLS